MHYDSHTNVNIQFVESLLHTAEILQQNNHLSESFMTLYPAALKVIYKLFSSQDASMTFSHEKKKYSDI